VLLPSGRVKLSRIRVLVQVGVHVLLIGHVLAYYLLDWRRVGALDFQTFFHHFLGDGLLTAGALLAIAAYGSALVFGRLFCSWGCHFGATQDLAAWVLKRLKWRPPLVRTRFLHYTPFLVLIAVFLAPLLSRWQSSGFELKHRGVDLSAVAPWDTLPGWVGSIIMFAMCGAGILLFLGTRGFCRFVCPYGAIFRLTDLAAPFRVRKVAPCSSRCSEDGVHPCTAACPTAIDVHRETSEHGCVTRVDCVRCNLCIEACPSHALAHVTNTQAAAIRSSRAPVVAEPSGSLRLLNVPILAGARGSDPPLKEAPGHDLPVWGECLVLAVAAAAYVCFDLVYGGHFVAAAFALAEGFLAFVVLDALLGSSKASVLGRPLRRGRAWTFAGVTAAGAFLITTVPLFEAGAFKWLRAQGVRLDPSSDPITAVDRDRLAAAAERYRLALEYFPQDESTQKLLLSAYARLGDPRARSTAEALYRSHPSAESRALLEWVLLREPPAPQGIGPSEEIRRGQAPGARVR